MFKNRMRDTGGQEERGYHYTLRYRVEPLSMSGFASSLNYSYIKTRLNAEIHRRHGCDGSIYVRKSATRTVSISPLRPITKCSLKVIPLRKWRGFGTAGCLLLRVCVGYVLCNLAGLAHLAGGCPVDYEVQGLHMVYLMP